MNMTPEEQRALVQFFGTVHAQAKQTDQMIVGNSQFVKPVSPVIEQQLRQALTAPVSNNAPSYPPPVQQPPPPPVADVPPPQPRVEYQPQVPPVTSGDLVEVLKDISLHLSRIATILEKKNEPKKIKNTKPA